MDHVGIDVHNVASQICVFAEGGEQRRCVLCRQYSIA